MATSEELGRAAEPTECGSSAVGDATSTPLRATKFAYDSGLRRPQGRILSDECGHSGRREVNRAWRTCVYSASTPGRTLLTTAEYEDDDEDDDKDEDGQGSPEDMPAVEPTNEDICGHRALVKTSPSA